MENFTKEKAEVMSRSESECALVLFVDVGSLGKVVQKNIGRPY